MLLYQALPFPPTPFYMSYLDKELGCRVDPNYAGASRWRSRVGGGGYFKAPLMSCFVYTPSLEARQICCLPFCGIQVQPGGWAKTGAGQASGFWGVSHIHMWEPLQLGHNSGAAHPFVLRRKIK